MDAKQEKLTDILKNAKLCAFVLDNNPKEESFLLKTALEAIFKETGAETISLPFENETVNQYKEKWARLLKNGAGGAEKQEKPARKNIIKIPKKDLIIKELTYDEDDEFFSLIIVSKNGVVSKDSFVIEEQLPRPDAFLCFFDDILKLERFSAEIKIPEQKEAVFLFDYGRSLGFDLEETKQSENGDFISAYQDGAGALTAKVVAVSRALKAEITSEVASLLFAALVLETNGFKQLTDKNIFSLANFLLLRGADAGTVIDILNDEKTDSFVQLLGRSAARTQYDEALAVLWVFLQASDFEKTKNTPSLNLVLRLMKELENMAKQSKVLAFFWQKGKEVWVVLKSREHETLLNLANMFNLRANSDYIVTGPYENFSEAEIKTRDILREVKIKEKQDIYFNGEEEKLDFNL